MNNLEEIGYLDYDKLKQYGLEYIQQIGHVNWSDYNLHDPGVTFLEALCFSLVDLGYRTQLPVEDYLTPKGENILTWMELCSSLLIRLCPSPPQRLKIIESLSLKTYLV